MSTPLAIAAVTQAFRGIIVDAVKDELTNSALVTTRPPDKVNDENDHVNVYLYHVTPDATWRNMDMPRQVRPGETAAPPLALVLHYLVTAYGPKDHRLLGLAMLGLHDHPVLHPTLILESKLDRQIEPARITPQPLTVDEITKLWGGFQTQFRVSAAYQVSPVLIDSTTDVKAALPVLKRGDQNRGPIAEAGAAPYITGLIFPEDRPSALPGDIVRVQGQNLSTEGVTARFVHPMLDPKGIELAVSRGEIEGEIQITLPGNPVDLAEWAPGFYSLALVVKREDVVVATTNELAMGFAPMITRDPNKGPEGSSLTITSMPRVREKQRTLLIVGNRQAEPRTITNDAADTSKPTTLVFDVPKLDKRTGYVIRLRVDGVDSIPVIQAGDPPQPGFDPAQQFEIT